MQAYALIAALCLSLSGCGAEPALEVRPERWCAASAYVDLVNTSTARGRYAGWELVDSAGSYDLPTFELGPGEALRVWRGAGQTDEHNLYLAQPEPAWDYSRETVAVQGGGLFQEVHAPFTSIHCDPAP